MTEELPWLADALAALVDEGLLRKRRTVAPLSGDAVEVNGRRLWNFAANDYLGLASDPRVIAAAHAALESNGVGARASALVSGRGDWHQRLEETLARFEGQAAALLFPTGFAANLGTLTALIGTDDVVYCDRLNHASLIDGCRLAGAKFRVYRHTELDRLERELRHAAIGQHRWIVTDSVFSMDGDLAPLAELCDLADRYDAKLIVDEAHGTGVFGENGRGVAELQGVEDRIAVRIGTLSKAIGTLGGFVTGSKELIDFLWNKARTQIYSTALPPAICAAAVTALEIIQSEPQRRSLLLQLCADFRRQLTDAGVTPLAGAVGPIVPIVLHDPRRAVTIAEQLEARGFLVGAIRPPTVPRGTSRLRITLHAGMANTLTAELATQLGELCAEK